MISELDNKVNSIFNVDDKLGVSLMGRNKWNALKGEIASAARRRVMQGRGAIISTAGIKAAARSNVDPVTARLFGFNHDAGAELLGYDWSTFTRQVRNATHNVLNVGAQIPITSGLVSTVRSIGDLFSFGKKANTETDNAIDAAAAAIKANKVKTALILGGVGLGTAGLIYFMGKKKKRKGRK